MTVLADLFALEDLDRALDDGLVRVQDHPALPLRIFNYTEKAQYTQMWTPVTLACRGLIVDAAQSSDPSPLPGFWSENELVEHPR